MKIFRPIYFVFIFAVLLVGCASQKVQPKPSDLIGTWKTGVRDTEWGKVTIEVTFKNSSELEFNISPVADEHGQDIPIIGQYTLAGGLLTSEAINKGSPVSIWLENGALVIESPGEEPMRFTRTKP